MARTIIGGDVWNIIVLGMCTEKAVARGVETKINKEGFNPMGTPIEYQKLMTEIVYINLPGPEDPAPNMTGGELLHGFLAELYRLPNQEFKDNLHQLCNKWNVRYRSGTTKER
jgi:hypothetical protein